MQKDKTLPIFSWYVEFIVMIRWKNHLIRHYFHPFRDKIFTLAVMLKVWAHTPSEVVNYNCLNQSGTSWLPETWIMRDELYILYVYIYFLGCFKISPHLLQFLRKMPQSRFAVQLRKSFVDDETSPSCSSARGRVDNGWVFISGWTFPLRVCNLFVTPYFNHLIEHGTII